ncbi:MAG: aminotransferase class V-fold PLP-dependent enzyme [Oscillospiraceae bacterium]|nr:aminotransferase class V-fold PLP-dependent enzyme [Oscillospiraceae bacterium]
MIYADHAATTRPGPEALCAMRVCLEENWGNPSSLHQSGQRAAAALEDARRRVAACIGASPREIYFTAGGSEADNQALCSAARAGARRGRTHIVSTAFEHHAVLHALEALAEEGFEVQLLDVPPDGVVSAAQVAAAIRADTCLVSVMSANNELGTVQPVAELGALCRARGIPFHTDAVQAAGHLPVDVAAQQVDYLALSAHKFGGPKGAGVLYARRGLPVAPLIRGGAQERGQRGGTENLPALAGMAAALEASCRTLEAEARRLTRLRDRLTDGLSRIPHAALNGDPARRLPGHVSFCFEGVEGESLLLLLDEAGICASSGSACTSGSLEPSHVLLAIGRPAELAHGSLRLTLGPENTEADVDAILEAVPAAVARLRAMSPLWRDKINGKKPFLL